jgi:hypothetical protein
MFIQIFENGSHDILDGKNINYLKKCTNGLICGLSKSILIDYVPENLIIEGIKEDNYIILFWSRHKNNDETYKFWKPPKNNILV